MQHGGAASLKALARKLDRLAADTQQPVEFWAEDFAEAWHALVELNSPAQDGPAVHRERLEVLR